MYPAVIDVYPSVADRNCWTAELRYRELVAEGQHQQFVARMCKPSAQTRSALAAIRHQFGALLVRAGQRLQGAQAVARESGVSTAPGELGAIA